MKYLRLLFRNKYLLALFIFGIYILFLDDVDIVKIYQQKSKLRELRAEKKVLLEKYDKTKHTLEQLNDDEALEKYAREKKFFKNDNEDIFVIDYEK